MLPGRVKQPAFKRTLKSSRVALNHLPKEIFVAIPRTSFLMEHHFRQNSMFIFDIRLVVWYLPKPSSGKQLGLEKMLFISVI